MYPAKRRTVLYPNLDEYIFFVEAYGAREIKRDRDREVLYANVEWNDAMTSII